MSVHKVVITSADEEYAPPEQEIEVTVIGDHVYLTVYEGSDDNKPSTKKLAYEVPPLTLHDLIAALSAFGSEVLGLHVLPATQEKDKSNS